MSKTADRRDLVTRLRTEGQPVTAIAAHLGITCQRVYQLLKPVPPNPCRKCGGLLPKWKQYHPECLPSRRPSTGRPRGRRPKPLEDLTGRTFGSWTVVGPSDVRGKWVARCKCGTSFGVLGYSLITGASRSCRKCSSRRRAV